MIAGLDVGTTGCKLVVFENNGIFVDKFYQLYKTLHKNGGNEIDGNSLISAVYSVIGKACNKYKLTSIGIDSFGEAFVMLDKNDKPLTNIMISSDSRGGKEAEFISKKVGEKRIEKITGLKANQTYSLPKILWEKNNHPDIFKKCQHILLMEDYVIYMLTGNAYIDYTLATRTLAFDFNTSKFSHEILDAVSIDINLFSKPVPTCFNCGKIRQAIKRKIGLKNDVFIATAGHDQIAVAIGSGVLDKKVAVDGAGTVECITPVFGSESINKKLIENNYAKVPFIKKNQFVTYAFSFTSGSLIDWFTETFAKQFKNNKFAVLEKGFCKEPSGLLVLPHFSGAACPYMDHSSKGAIVGLTLQHTLSNIYQGVLEGIAYEMRINVDTLKECNVTIDRFVATGGGAASKKWLQIKSDILNLPIDILSDNESGSKGAAIAAGVATKLFKNIQEASKIMVKKVDTILPNQENIKKYDLIYKKYKKLYKAVKRVI